MSVNPPLPNSLQFNVVSPGTISGTPLAGTNGTTNHTFTVIDSAIPFNQTNNTQLSLTINLTLQPLTITFPPGRSLPTGTPITTTFFSRTYTVLDSTLPTNRTVSRSISLRVRN